MCSPMLQPNIFKAGSGKAAHMSVDATFIAALHASTTLIRYGSERVQAV